MICDLALARRLEHAEGTANARFVEARARIAPQSGAQWIEVAGAFAMFDGPTSPCTQTFGLGLFQMPSAADMERIESFFRDRGAPVFHEESPLADPALLDLLNSRGYRPVELSSVMFLPLADRPPAPPVPGIVVRIAGENERDLWARTSTDGWRDDAGFDLGELMQVVAARLTEDDVKAVAAYLASLPPSQDSVPAKVGSWPLPFACGSEPQ